MSSIPHLQRVSTPQTMRCRTPAMRVARSSVRQRGSRWETEKDLGAKTTQSDYLGLAVAYRQSSFLFDRTVRTAASRKGGSGKGSGRAIRVDKLRTPRLLTPASV